MNRRHFIKTTILSQGILIALMTAVTYPSLGQVIKDSGSEVQPAPPYRSDTVKILEEKVLLEYISFAPLINPNPKIAAPFNKLRYDKIIAYDFGDGYSEETLRVIDPQGRFVSNISKQQALSQAKADNILTALTTKSTYGGSNAICFNPRFALVFYKGSKVVNQINICMDCNYLVSEIDIPAQNHIAKKVSKNEYAQTGIGFSESGRKAIIDFCKDLSFYYGSLEI